MLFAPVCVFCACALSIITLTYTHTHTHTHTHHTIAVLQLLPPSDNTGMPGTTQTLEPSAENPPEAGLVTRRTVQVSKI